MDRVEGVTPHFSKMFCFNSPSFSCNPRCRTNRRDLLMLREIREAAVFEPLEDVERRPCLCRAFIAASRPRPARRPVVERMTSGASRAILIPRHGGRASRRNALPGARAAVTPRQLRRLTVRRGVPIIVRRTTIGVAGAR